VPPTRRGATRDFAAARRGLRIRGGLSLAVRHPFIIIVIVVVVVVVVVVVESMLLPIAGCVLRLLKRGQTRAREIGCVYCMPIR